jgi:hypothetical protein
VSRSPRLPRTLLATAALLALLLLYGASAGAGAAWADSPPPPTSVDPQTATDEEWAAGYITESFDVDARVSRDNSYYITETIKVYFLLDSHGIYRDIPVAGTAYYRDNDGNTIEMNARMMI